MKNRKDEILTTLKTKGAMGRTGEGEKLYTVYCLPFIAFFPNQQFNSSTNQHFLTIHDSRYFPG